MLPIGDQTVRPTNLIFCMDMGIMYKTDMANLKGVLAVKFMRKMGNKSIIMAFNT